MIFDFPPNAPTGLDVSDKTTCGTTITTTVARPKFYAQATNNNPGYTTVDLAFEVHNSPSTGSPVVSSGQFNVPENSRSEWATPTALPDGPYALRVQSQTASPQNTDLTAWSSWYYFRVDTQPPGLPTITSTAYPENQWGAPSGQNGTFTFSSTPEVAGFAYGIDQAANAPSTCTWNATGLAGTIAATNGTASFTVPSTLTAGYHAINVKTMDTAHHSSNARTYVFYVRPPSTATTFDNLQASFNNNGITGSGLAGDIDLTASKSSIDATLLGSSVPVGTTTFARPAELTNGNDNTIAGGQKILLQPQLAKAVHLLVASTCGATPASFNNSLSLTYNAVDDPTDVLLPATPDWLASPGANSRALPGAYKTGTTAAAGQPVVYKLSVTSDNQTQKLTSITLPTLRTNLTPTTLCSEATLHVLAINVEAP